MQSKITIHTDVNDNPLNADRIEFLEFNFDGLGGALVRYDNDQFVSVLERERVYTAFLWESKHGKRFEIVASAN